MRFPWSRVRLTAMASSAEPAGASQPSVSAADRNSFHANDAPSTGVTRKNGIFFKAQQNVSIEDYLDSFHACLPDIHVPYASRISSSRVALYLATRENVADAITNGFTHDETFLDLTPLVQPSTRLTMSNVYPEIPNSVLLHYISSFCKVVSPIRLIPLGLKKKALSHIMSFRRHVQILVKPNLSPSQTT